MSEDRTRGISLPGNFMDPNLFLSGPTLAEMRKAVGFDQMDMAQALAAGELVETPRTYERYERFGTGSRDQRAMPGSARLALSYLFQGSVVEANGHEIPSHVVERGQTGEGWVVRLRAPRYVGVLARHAYSADAAARDDGMILSILLWLDQPRPEMVRTLARQIPVA